ncbi:MAG: A/G-specific adenine glycosylase [Cytophagales bacterium]|nr:A/G-specific adenine glycosylase [Cytophagales bacterium]
MINELFSNPLILWYEQNKRDLPWRTTTDPYYIWLSEIILQQTRVAQGQSYYEDFVNSYPSVHDLAQAEEEEVLRKWQGLGYYSRARNLHFTAKYISEELNGVFPDTYDNIVKLKGVGEYTAAAIASFSFNEDVAVLDGNVYRVLSRYFGEKADISASKSKKFFQKLAQEALPQGQADIYNQAIMEFGALHCKPQNPYCALCPVQTSCYAFDKGEQENFPVKTKKIKIKKRYFHYVILEQEGKFYLNKRVKKGIWQNLYDFFLVEHKKELNTEELMKELIQEQVPIANAKVVKQGEQYKHVLSHQHIFAQFWHIQLENTNFNKQGLELFSYKEVEELPKPILIANHFSEFFEE